MKPYCGSPVGARNYVEAGRARADDYYLAEGTGIAQRYVAGPETGVQRGAPLSGDAYEAWVAGVDPDTGVPKGRLRHDDNAVRFVEVTVNGPKSWSLAAELHPDISAAYDAAQERAATQIVGWLAQHATTRVGTRGHQVQVPVQEIEAVTVAHRTSRAGDPHRHLHLQVNARVFAEGQWRGLHTVGVRDSIYAINGIGHAAVATDRVFRNALAAHGFALDQAGEIRQLAPFVGAFSARAAQIGRNIERYEAHWTKAHPGQTPGPGLRRSWDARAWAEDRPDKIHPVAGADLNGRWVAELHALGYTDPGASVSLARVTVGSLDRDRAVTEVLDRLAARHSGWNAPDVRGEVEQLLARRGIVTDHRVRVELAEDLTARAVESCVPLLDRVEMPEHIRALTSARVLEVETDLVGRLASRGTAPAAEAVQANPATAVQGGRRLDETQAAAAAALAGANQLVVVEGAAGSGKTATLSAARDLLKVQGRQLVVVTPTLKAAKVAQAELGARAGSAAWLVFQHGYRWDEHGAWTRLEPGQRDPQTGREYRSPTPVAVVRAGDLLLVDEAGMMDQDTARALLTIADEQQVRVALMGDRHQLSAVGRGGVLELAARWVDPDAHLTLEQVHRFTRTITTQDGRVEVIPDVEYANLTLAMRTGTNPEVVFAALLGRGRIQVHGTEAQRSAELADVAAHDITHGRASLVIADTRDQVAELNAAIHKRLVDAGHVNDAHLITTDTGQRIGIGDRIVTRHNDTTLDVANRDAWMVTGVDRYGTLNVTGHPADGGRLGSRSLPAGYVAEHVELGYASTVHGVQGDTADAAHLLIAEHTGASSAYVGMTRGRTVNVAHLVAADVDGAREQWIAVFARDRADLGPSHAAELAAQQAANYAQPRTVQDMIAELHQAWTSETHAVYRLANVEPEVKALRQIVAARAEHGTDLPAPKTAWEQAGETAANADVRAQNTAAVVAQDGARIREAMLRDWAAQRPAAAQAAQTVATGAGRFGLRRAAVAEASAVLQGWSATWQPYLPDLPTDPAELARRATGDDNQAGIRDAFDGYAQRRSAQLHPEHAEAQMVAQQARMVEREAGVACRAGVALEDGLRRHYGKLGGIADPAGQLAEDELVLTATRDQLTHARTDIAAITYDLTRAGQAAARVTIEREAWQYARDITALVHASKADAENLAALRERNSRDLKNEPRPRHGRPQEPRPRR